MATILTFLAAALTVLGLALLPASSRGDRGPRLLRLLAAAGSLIRPPRAPRELEARLAAAGHPGGIGVRELMAAKVAGAVAAGCFGSLLAATAPGRLGLVFALGAPVAGFLAPDLHLLRAAAARARRVRRELPVLLDLLRVQVEAGAPLHAALPAVGDRARGPLAAEWRTLGREVALGVPLEHALSRLERRLPLPEVGALVAALDRARRHGAPLGETLAAQATEARFAWARRVREEAARGGPKIQLVVALLLVPSVLLLVAAALVSALLGSEGGLLPI